VPGYFLGDQTTCREVERLKRGCFFFLFDLTSTELNRRRKMDVLFLPVYLCYVLAVWGFICCLKLEMGIASLTAAC